MNDPRNITQFGWFFTMRSTIDIYQQRKTSMMPLNEGFHKTFFVNFVETQLTYLMFIKEFSSGNLGSPIYNVQK